MKIIQSGILFALTLSSFLHCMDNQVMILTKDEKDAVMGNPRKSPSTETPGNHNNNTKIIGLDDLAKSQAMQELLAKKLDAFIRNTPGLKENLAKKPELKKDLQSYLTEEMSNSTEVKVIVAEIAKEIYTPPSRPWNTRYFVTGGSIFILGIIALLHYYD